MDQQGWIKDYRKELDSDIWVMPPLYYKVWQYLKYMANHKTTSIPMADGTKEIIERGQHLTSYRAISRGVGYYEGPKLKEPNPKTIKKIIEWMVKNSMITVTNGKGNRQYTKISIVNYSVYQSDNVEGVTDGAQQSNSKVTPSTQQSNSKVTAGKQSVDINKNDKNDKEGYKNEEEGKEVPPSLPPLSYPSSLHKLFYKEYGEIAYRTWFMDCNVKEVDNRLVIAANNFQVQIIKNKYLKRLEILTGKKISVEEG